MKKKNNIFLKAAKIISDEKETFACFAISPTLNSGHEEEMEFFKDLFDLSDNAGDKSYTFEGKLFNKKIITKEEGEIAKNFRILALLFAHEVYNDKETYKSVKH